MKKLVFKSLFAASLVAAVLAGCKKESKDEVDTDTSANEDNAFAEHTSSDIIDIGSEAADGGSLSNFRTENESSLLACATVTRDTINHIVTVTFNCPNRTGTLYFNYSASPPGSRHYRDPGFTCTVTSNNYVAHGNQVNIINKTITNITHGGNPVGYDPMTENERWHITADVSITRPNGAVLTWNCDRIKELLNTSTVGFPGFYNDFTNFPASDTVPINWHQARVGITGSATGTRTYNNVTQTISTTITNQLVRDFGACNINGHFPFFIGELDHTRSGHPTRHLNFGSNSTGQIMNQCDKWVLITPPGVVRPLF